MRSPSRSTPSFSGLRPASRGATLAARGSSIKRDTRCEIQLRRALHQLGLRYRIDAPDLPGRPDVVFRAAKVAVFCDGDFWHGRDLEVRLERLRAGHNAPYWVEKIKANVARDGRNAEALERAGWTVIRCWETDVRRSPAWVAASIAQMIAARATSGAHRHADQRF